MTPTTKPPKAPPPLTPPPAPASPPQTPPKPPPQRAIPRAQASPAKTPVTSKATIRLPDSVTIRRLCSVPHSRTCYQRSAKRQNVKRADEPDTHGATNLAPTRPEAVRGVRESASRKTRTPSEGRAEGRARRAHP